MAILWVALILVPQAIFWSVPALGAEEGWPLNFQHENYAITMYQPQVQEFAHDQITSLAAVALKQKGQKEPVFGVVWITARALTDRDTRMVTIDQPQVTDIRFLDVKESEQERLKGYINEALQGRSYMLSLDRLLASLDLLQKERSQEKDLKNDPPKIIFVTHPAVLVPLAGEPRLLPIPDSKLMRVANTAFLMVYDPGNRTYYLRAGQVWLGATDLKGPWQEVLSPADPLKVLAEDINKKSGQTAKAIQAKPGAMPEIIVSTEPAELLATDGEPQYTPIAGTGLLFVSNTESNIFLDTASQDYYVLLAGRWFTSRSLKDGPWTFVPPAKLTPDFAKIPEKSTKGFILASVPGTPQAKEGVLDSYIPQTAAISRKKATITVKYDGSPQFRKIPNTSLEYAVNAATAVFKEGDKYYACVQGVWYEADSPDGPWRVSVSPPADVAKIPPSNPHYNVKYVKVYDATDDTAYVGYTPGYAWSFDQDGSMVYGTGYDYPPYASDNAYISYPCTYGYAPTYDPYAATWGFLPSYYTPWNWLGAGLIGAGVAALTWAPWDFWWNHYYPRVYYGGSWWGPVGYVWQNVNITHNYLYGRFWNTGNRWAGYYPGWKGGPWPGVRAGVRQTPQAFAHLRPNIYTRPWNQQFLWARPAAITPGQIGITGRTGVQVLRGRQGENNIFTDKQGQVYRRGQRGMWEMRQGNQWSPFAGPKTTVMRPTVPRTRVTPQMPHTPTQTMRPTFENNRLIQEFNARQRGQIRTQQFQRYQTFQGPHIGRPSGGFRAPGGVMRGGGGGGPRGDGSHR